MTSDRKPLLAAGAFAVLLGLAYGWAELPPGVHASGQAVLTWTRMNDRALATQALLVMLAWLPGAALFALVHRRMDGAPAAAFLLGGGLLMSLVAVGALLRVGLARHAADLDPSVARLVLDLEAHWGPLATVAVALQASALGFATRHGAFPGWLLPITTTLALEQLVETLTIVGGDGFMAPGGLFNQLGAALFALWVLAQGVAASRWPGLQPAPAGTR